MAIAITAAGAAAEGAKAVYNMAGADFSIVCTVVVENKTKYPLIDPECYINAGEIQSLPAEVRPGHTEKFVAHKKSNSMAGTSGIASWMIKGQSKRVVVMWNCPYSATLFRNWLAVGLTDYNIGDSGEAMYDQMFGGESDHNLKFARRDYCDNMKTLSIKSRKIEITGIMGTSQKTTVNIVVKALDENNK